MAIIVPIVSSWNPKGLDRAVKDIQRAEGNFKKFSIATQYASKTFGDWGKSLTRNVTVPLAGLAVAINKSVSDASALAEAQSKVTAVFGKQATEVQKWSKTTAAAFGISSRQALQAAGTYGNLFQAFGIGQTQAKDMSMRMVELAADMASFNDVSIDETLTALRSGLSGETEPLKRFGVALLDVRLKEQALSMGLIKTTSGVLPPAIKAQAAYALILKDTSLQQGDVARTAQGLASQKKFLAAQVEDLSASFGAVFMPVMINFIGVLRNSILPQMQKFIEAFKTLSPNAITTGIKIALFVAALGPMMIAISYAIKLVQALSTAFQILYSRIVLIPALIIFVAAAIAKGLDSSKSWSEAVYTVVRGVVIGLVQVGNAALEVFNIFIRAYNGIARLLNKDTISHLSFDFVIKGMDSAYSAVSKFSKAMAGSAQDLSAITMPANEFSNAIAGSGAGSVAGGTDAASKAMDDFKDKLDKAKQSLSDAKQKFDDFASSIAGSIKSVLNFGRAAEAETGTFLENLVAQANQAKEFAKRVSTLISMGLSERGISQVLDAGAEAGTKIADEIIAGGSTVINQVNELVAATETLADQVGQYGADAFYSAGVKQGQALVDGVISAIKAAGFTIDENGNIVNPLAGVSGVVGTPAATTGGGAGGGAGGGTVTQPKTALELQAGRIANKLSRMPMMASGGIVNKPTVAMIGEAGPEAVIPLSRMGKTGAVYNITVNAGMGTNGAQVGKEIVDAIKRYERASGPVFASA